MKEFIHYLKKEGYSSSTAEKSMIYARKYIKWLEEHNLKIEDTEYRDLLNYISHLQSQNFKRTYINHQITCLGYYYNYLNLPNITYKVRILGSERRSPLLLSEEELNEIYNNYETENPEEKLMLSLIIYQGITREETLKLTIKSINLEKGQIEIPGTNYRNSRMLNLESHQVIPFYNHIEKKKEEREEILFTKCKTHWVLSKFLTLIHKNLKKQNKTLNLKQLRQSRYTIYIKNHGLRIGQHMSGFKSIKTAERYRKKDITDLKAAIAKYHPLNEV